MYPYPYGPQYPQPWYTPPKPARTPQGIRWTYVAFVLYLVGLAAAVLLALAVFLIVANLAPNATLNDITGPLTGAFAGRILVLILGVIVLAFYFVGFGYLYGGRNEFGPAHARNVRLALYLILAALVASLVGDGASLILGWATIRHLPGGVVQVDPGAYYLAVAASAIVSILSAALAAAALVLSLRELARPGQQRLLYAAAALGTATPGIVGALTLWQLPRFLTLVQAYLDAQAAGTVTAPPLDPSFGVPEIAGAALGLVTFALFVFVCRGVRARLKAGELKPILPPAAPVTPWMPTPVAPAYPGAPYPAVPYPAAPSAPPQGPPP